jgi:hypothetical protein
MSQQPHTWLANAGHDGAFLDLPIGGAVVSSADQDSRIRWDFDNPIELGETTMRLPVLILLFIAAALLGECIGASAQSARSYPVCAMV